MSPVSSSAFALACCAVWHSSVVKRMRIVSKLGRSSASSAQHSCMRSLHGQRLGSGGRSPSFATFAMICVAPSSG
eukprot:scaffold1867_cov247-Pinguiococcus_pyrenoidosus.AAC.16